MAPVEVSVMFFYVPVCCETSGIRAGYQVKAPAIMSKALQTRQPGYCYGVDNS